MKLQECVPDAQLRDGNGCDFLGFPVRFGEAVCPALALEGSAYVSEILREVYRWLPLWRRLW